MGETSNTSKIAEIVSKEIFPELGWEREGPINIDWKCVNLSHEKEKHPTDIVFSYIEPYTGIRTYVNCDLKSYNSTTLANKDKLSIAIKSLSMAVSCAQKSQEWQTHYLRDDKTAEVVGMLFIYNHDGLYDKNFYNMLNNALEDGIHIARKDKVFVFSPLEICTLLTVINDIQISRGKKELPDSESCSFFYPDQISRVVVRNAWKQPASLEMLKSSLIIIKYKTAHAIPNYDGVYIYYKRNGGEVEEFIYLIDYLFHYQIISTGISIKIKLLNPAPEATAVFTRAIKAYTSRYNISEELSERLKTIAIETVKNIRTQFSEIEIGMEE